MFFEEEWIEVSDFDGVVCNVALFYKIDDIVLVLVQFPPWQRTFEEQMMVHQKLLYLLWLFFEMQDMGMDSRLSEQDLREESIPLMSVIWDDSRVE